MLSDTSPNSRWVQVEDENTLGEGDSQRMNEKRKANIFATSAASSEMPVSADLGSPPSSARLLLSSARGLHERHRHGRQRDRPLDPERLKGRRRAVWRGHERQAVETHDLAAQALAREQVHEVPVL